MFEEHKAVMFIIEPESGRIIYANKAASDFYKFTRQELLGMSIDDLNTLPSEKLLMEREKAAGEKKNHFIFRHKLAIGNTRWVEVYSSPFRSEGQLLLFSIIHDIDKRIKDEEALAENREKFAKAFMSNPNAIILSEKESGIIIDVNDSFTAMTGLSRESLLGRSTLDLNIYEHPSDRKKMIEKLNIEGRLRNYELMIRGIEGKKLHVLVQMETLGIRHSEMIITTLQDISEIKGLEKKLREEHDLLRTIIDTVPAMITIYDPSFSKIEVNKEFSRVTGWNPGDYENDDLMKLAYPDPDYRSVISGFMKSLEPGYRDLVMTGKDGSLIDTSWANVMLPDGRRVGIGIDIRQRKKLETELQEKNNNLTKINELFEDFVHIAAHDLRGPVANLASLSEMIESQPSVEAKSSLFPMLLPVVRKLKHTVEGLLETLSIQTGDEDIGRKLSFDEVYSHVIEELRIEGMPQNVKVVPDFSKVPEIIFVEAHLRSILKNLLSNAVKYSAGTENPLVKISSRRNSGYIVLSVTDNGIGIDLDAVGKDLFKPFSRFTDKAEGTGMGLYIIKKIIEKNGGHIEVISLPDKGTTFNCFLKKEG